jgi:CRP-like cAMP-binding protein
MLQTLTEAGVEIATVRKWGIVGEMGVLTNQPRSATVVSQRASKVLSIPNEPLQRLIEEDTDMGLQIYRNVTHLLSARLRENNISMEQQFLIFEDLIGDKLSE